MAHSGKLKLPFGKKQDLHNFCCIINKCFSEITKENLLLYFWFWIWKRQMWKLNQNLFEIFSSCSSREKFLLHPRADMFHLIGYACDYCYIQIINGFVKNDMHNFTFFFFLCWLSKIVIILLMFYLSRIQFRKNTDILLPEITMMGRWVVTLCFYKYWKKNVFNAT